jgi:hypothetical protein
MAIQLPWPRHIHKENSNWATNFPLGSWNQSDESQKKKPTREKLPKIGCRLPKWVSNFKLVQKLPNPEPRLAEWLRGPRFWSWVGPPLLSAMLANFWEFWLIFRSHFLLPDITRIVCRQSSGRLQHLEVRTSNLGICLTIVDGLEVTTSHATNTSYRLNTWVIQKN